MKKLMTFCLLMQLLTLSGCEAIGDIFSAGVYTGVFIAVFVVVIIIVILVRLGKRG